MGLQRFLAFRAFLKIPNEHAVLTHNFLKLNKANLLLHFATGNIRHGWFLGQTAWLK